MYDPLIKEYQGQFGHGWTVGDIVAWVEDLPPMPNIVTRAIRLVDDIKTTPGDLAAVIMLDPSLATPIMRAANSARMGHQREVTTLDLAILVVGMGQVKTVLLASALRRWNNKFGSLERVAWEKALGAATAARVICQELEKGFRDELHLTGLLHNLGQIVLLSHKEVGAKYRTVLERMAEKGEDYVTAEREVIGFTHPLVGALVAWKWGFPQSLCKMILHYADPLENISDEAGEKQGVLKMAIEVGMAAGLGCPEKYKPESRIALEKLAALMGYEQATLASGLDQTINKTRARFTTEAGSYV
jgi:HD-like signal output (HDOD) protein